MPETLPLRAVPASIIERVRRHLGRCHAELGPDVCWEWQGYRGDGGYGIINARKLGRVRVHRIALYIAKGDAPPGKPLALHSCDNPSCINPAHLRYGDDAENSRDMVRRGRARNQFPGCRRILAPDGRSWPSAEAAAKETGMSRQGIYGRCLRGTDGWGYAPA